jgi:hypothetical protein
VQCNLMGYSATCYSSTAINLDTERVRYAVVDEGLYLTPYFRGYRVKKDCEHAGPAGKLACNLGGMSKLCICFETVGVKCWKRQCIYKIL